MSAAIAAAPRPVPHIDVMGHPRGIYVIFLTEMWERYSYYGMRALLIFYLTQHFNFEDTAATLYYGAYTALVYASSVLGGLLADRLIGQWRSAQVGGLMILSGHVMLAVEGQLGEPTDFSRQVFFLALGLIIAGTGCFKPCMATLLGAQYGEKDPRRQTGFFIFYIGINLGSALAAFSVGYLGQTFGWSYGFGAAAVGMAAGLIVINLGKADIEPYAPIASGVPLPLSFVIATALCFALIAWALVQRPEFVGYTLIFALTGGLGALFWFMAKDATQSERAKLWAVILLIIGVAIYWSTFELAGSALNLFAARVVDMNAGLFTLKPSQTQSFNSSFILILTPVMAVFWSFLAKRGLEPGVGFKFAGGLALSGTAFSALVIGLSLAGHGNKVGLYWLVLYYMLQTIAEICLSPVGLSMMTKLAPARLGALVMGLWYMAASIGNFFAAQIATLTARVGEAGVAVDAVAEAAQYQSVFYYIALYSFGAALIFGLLGYPITRLAAEQKAHG